MSSSKNNPFSLTDREHDVLLCMAEGSKNKEIAEFLDLSVGTVHWYTKQIYRKMGVNSRTQASLLARDSGLLMESYQRAISFDSGQYDGLPTYGTRFVGRDTQIEHIENLIHQQDARLITITGHGGTGKTRLAIEIAHRQVEHFKDGVFYIPLIETAKSYENLRNVLQRYLKIKADETASYVQISTKQLLIILDNFEHIHHERDEIVRLLRSTHSLKIIATSQLSLGLQQEYLIQLNGLSTKPDNHEASELFAECVRRFQPNFSLDQNNKCVWKICRLVDGIPLAIELSAAWLRSISCDVTLCELEENLNILQTTAADIPDRHRSLQAVFDHAWKMLSSDEKKVLRRLSVMRGEFGFTAVEHVAGASIHSLSRLVQHSLVQKTTENSYHIHNLVRRYAEEKLRAGEDHGKESKIALAMLSLLKGEFNKVSQLAEELMTDSIDKANVDKGFGLAVLGVMAGSEADYDSCFQLCRSSLALIENEPIALLFSYLGMAIGSCGTEDFAQARQMIERAINSAQALGSPTLLALCLPVIAIVSAHETNNRLAVQAIGLAENDDLCLPEWLLEWKPLLDLKTKLKLKVDSDTFDKYWKAGMSTTTVELVSDFRRSK